MKNLALNWLVLLLNKIQTSLSCLYLGPHFPVVPRQKREQWQEDTAKAFSVYFVFSVTHFPLQKKRANLNYTEALLKSVFGAVQKKDSLHRNCKTRRLERKEPWRVNREAARGGEQRVLRVTAPPSPMRSSSLLRGNQSSSFPNAVNSVAYLHFGSSWRKLTPWALSPLPYNIPMTTCARKAGGQPPKNGLFREILLWGQLEYYTASVLLKEDTVLTGLKRILWTIQFFSLFTLTPWMLTLLILAQLPATTDMQEASSCARLVKCFLNKTIKVLQ